jgi:ligand-binding sensor domain-containing protein/signal transduction histidine kinase
MRRRENIGSIFPVPFIFLTIFLQIGLYTQENLVFNRISTEQGLSQSSVFCIAQDSKGFMWFGTQYGLNRYDGYTFKTFINTPGNPRSISDNYIQACIVDHAGVLWIGTYDGGLNKYNPDTDDFDRYMYKKDDPAGISHNRVLWIYEDRSYELWIGTAGGLNKLNRNTGTFTRYTHEENNPNSLCNDVVWSIFEDRHGELWIGTFEGLERFDRKNHRFYHYPHYENNPDSLCSNSVRYIYQDSAGFFWIGTRDGLDKFDRENNRFIHYKKNIKDPASLCGNKIRYIMEDSKKNLWIGTLEGLNRYDRKMDGFIHYVNDPTNPSSLSHNEIMCIYEDRSGILWVGVLGGINKIYRGNPDFSFYRLNITDYSIDLKDIKKNTNMIWAINETKAGKLWIGSSAGLSLFDLRKRKILEHYTCDDKSPQSLSDNTVRAIYEDRKGSMWIGTFVGGLYKFDRDNKTFTPISKDVLSKAPVYAILEDSHRNLWIGTSGNGLCNYNRSNGKITQYTRMDNQKNCLSDDSVLCLLEDRLGVLWIGTWRGGLNRLDDIQTGRFTAFVHDDRNQNSLSNNRVRCIHEQQGILWIGTEGGLNRFDPKTGSFKYYLQKDGLPSDVVYSILEDNLGNLWMSTMNGLVKFTFTTKDNYFTSFDIGDGLQSDEFNQGAFFKNRMGELFFGNIAGFAILTGKSKIDRYSPPVVITDFLLSNKKETLRILKSEMYRIKNNRISLEYNERVFSIEFAALHYANPKKNKYRYKLDGYDNEWIQTDYKNRRATYTNLPNGKYTFYVKGTNKDGIWSPNIASIKIKIRPPWYLTLWAYSFYFVFGVGVLLLIVYVGYIKNLIQKLKQADRALEQKIQELEQKNEELKNTQAKLVQSEKMASLGILTAGVAHQMNNPISFTDLAVHNLETDLKEFREFLKEVTGFESHQGTREVFDEKFKTLFDRLETMNRGITRISGNVKKLMEFSEPTRGEWKKRKLSEMLEINIDFARGKYIENVDFVTDFQFKPELLCDELNLNNAFMNIIINGCQAIVELQKKTAQKTRGKLTITTLQVNDNVAINFLDTGVGMSEEIQKHIFDPFFTTKPEGEGIGLGLSTSYSIIKQHKGRVEVKSEEGKGTLFTIYLPL